MARPTKQGLDYFPFDVDFFEDDKLVFVAKNFGTKGLHITVKLLCRIYKNDGYYTKWNNELAELFATRVGENITSSLVSDVVNELIKRDFFNKDIFKRFGILTSQGIQKRYLNVSERAKRKGVLIHKEYDCSGLIPDNSGVIPELSRSIPEKEKESKVKEIKEKESKTINRLEDFNLEFIQDSFIKTMIRYLDYRKKIKKPFKTQVGIEACYSNLLKLSQNDSEKAEAIVQQSIENEWQGLFEIKEKSSAKKENNGDSKNRFAETVAGINSILRK